MTKVCAQCKNFLGGGDWGISCKKMYGLTSESSRADDCENFEQETVCRNASSIVGWFRCSICGEYKNFVEVNKDRIIPIEEYVRISNEARQRVKKLTKCPSCGMEIINDN